MIQSGALKKLKDLNVEIHSRSVFLQGLLLMDPETLPEYFSSVRYHLIKYHKFLNANRLTPLEAVFDFVCGIQEIDCIVVGVNNPLQLRELCAMANPDALCTKIDYASFSIQDEMIVNPSHW